MTLNTGLIINGRYRIAKLLGEGGFGAVYQAWDLNLNQLCALKMNLDTSQEAQKQFQKEAAVLAKLSHPNLPRVTDRFFVQGQGQFLVMDFVEGEDLESMMSKGAIQPESAIEWVQQVADALNYLHNQPQPIIHRDIKPANIRVTPNGRAVLVDFGLVKVYDEHLKTTIGARAVTPGYSPPEQYGRGSTDAQTDIYALAATLYTLLTSEEPPESIQRIVEDTLKPVTQVNNGVGTEIEQAIVQAMSLAPSQRYGTVLDFTAALQETKKPVQEATTQWLQSTPPSQPVKEIELNQLYQQAVSASYQKDWALVETLCLKIQSSDSSYQAQGVSSLLSKARQSQLKTGYVSQGGGNNNWVWWVLGAVGIFIVIGIIVSVSVASETITTEVTRVVQETIVETVVETIEVTKTPIAGRLNLSDGVIGTAKIKGNDLISYSVMPEGGVSRLIRGGTVVEIMVISGNLLEIRVPTGHEGWLHIDLVEDIDLVTGVELIGYLIGDTVQIKGDDLVSYSVMPEGGMSRLVKGGTIVEIIDTSGNLLKIRVPADHEGWLNMDAVDPIE